MTNLLESLEPTSELYTSYIISLTWVESNPGEKKS